MAKMNAEERAAVICSQPMLTISDFEELGRMHSVRDLRFGPGVKFPAGAFQHLQGMRWMQFLTVEKSSLTPAHLRDITGISRLKRLWLIECEVTDAALKHLAFHLNLQDVWLHGSKITDAALKPLSTIPNLQWLDLDDTAITDKGLEHLCAAQKLSYLGLRNTAVTDPGILQLAVLPNLNMAGGYVTGTAVTEAGIDALFSARRDLRKSAKSLGKSSESKTTPSRKSANDKVEAKTGSSAKLGTASDESEEIEAAKKVLTEFFKAMNQWESEWHIQFSEDRDAAARKIFDDFCTNKKRAYGGPDNRPCGDPLAYDPDHEVIVNVELAARRRIVIETKRSKGFEGRYQYVLLKKGGRWLLDSKKRFTAGWENDIL